MKSTGGIIRACLILFAVLAGALGILVVFDVVAREDFLDWLWRIGAAVAIVCGIGIVTRSMGGSGKE